MNGRASWSYVQARLQARHGERLDDGDWRALEGAKSLDHYLERARATSLRRFTDRIEARMSSHVIERVLRAEWRRYIAEIAAWVPPVWQPPVLWVAHLPDLPVLDLLVQGAAPEWVRQDHLAAFGDDDTHRNLMNLDDSPLAPLSPAQGGAPAARWLAYWRTLWPRPSAVDRQWLDRLCAVVADNIARLARAGAQETSARYRGELARAATRLFRPGSATPVALFAHLVLVALDLERLRGGLVRRRLFAPSTERAA